MTEWTDERRDKLIDEDGVSACLPVDVYLELVQDARRLDWFAENRHELFPGTSDQGESGWWVMRLNSPGDFRRLLRDAIDDATIELDKDAAMSRESGEGE